MWSLEDIVRINKEAVEKANKAAAPISFSATTASFCANDGDDPEEVPLETALAKVAAGEWRECAICNANGYDDRLRSFHKS